MANALFLSGRWIDSAIVTASSVQGSLPADHVQTMDPTQVWRATGCAAEWLAWDHGEDVPTDAAVIIGHNLSADALIRLRLGATTALSSVDSGLISPWPTSGKPGDRDWLYYFSLAQVANTTGFRYGRLDIEDPTNPAGYVEIARLYAGPAFVPALNVDINPSLGLISPDVAGRTPYGRSLGDTRGPAARVLSVPMSAIDEDEMGEELFELQRYCGLARDFAFCLEPAATSRFHRYALQARFSALTSFQAQPVWNSASKKLWQTALTLEEVT